MLKFFLQANLFIITNFRDIYNGSKFVFLVDIFTLKHFLAFQSLRLKAIHLLAIVLYHVFKYDRR